MVINHNFRVWHYLKPNERSGTPSNFAFVACDASVRENDRVTGRSYHELKSWHGIATRLDKGKWTRRVEVTGTSAAGFWNWLYGRLDKRRPLWLWGHCVSHAMQLLSLGWELEHGNVEWQTLDYALAHNKERQQKVTWQGVVVLDDPPTVIELRHSQTRCKLWILDTLNFWRLSTDELRRTFNGGTDSEHVEACHVDTVSTATRLTAVAVEACVRSLVYTIRTKDLGNMRWTAASQGLQCYRHRFMKHKILVHCDNNSLKLERDSYFGGNVSLFRFGVVKGPVYVVDYQSFYPSIMASRPVPVKWLGWTDDNVRTSELSWCQDCWRIAAVTLDTSSVTFPVRHRNFLVMAKGVFRTTLQEPELALAISKSCVRRVHSVSWYSKSVIFDRFVGELWKLRKDAINRSADSEANFYKLLLNGVPGKLGQRQVKWVDEPERFASKPWGSECQINVDTGEVEHLRYLNGRVQRKRLQGEHVISNALDSLSPSELQGLSVPVGTAINDESSQSVPQIAGAITSWGRILLQETINVAGQENVYYTDTDCLHVNRIGYLRLFDSGFVKPGELGKLSVKCVAQEAEYRGCKYYRLEDTWVCSGRKGESTPIRDNVWEQEQFSGWSSLLYDGTCGELVSYKVKCDRSDDFIPGAVQPDGTVTPISLASAALAY